MARAAGIFSLLLVVLASCSSSTDLADRELIGRWDGVGALQSSSEGFGLAVYIESHAGGDGPIIGSWRRIQGQSLQGSLASGAVLDGEVTFRLAGFPGTDPTFEGRLTNQHRLEGAFDALPLEGSAVFRRGSIVP